MSNIIWITCVIIVILICILIRVYFGKDEDEDDIISSASRVGRKFSDCCVKKVRGMFGGGA